MPLKVASQTKIEEKVRTIFPGASFRKTQVSINAHIKSFNMSQMISLNDILADINPEIEFKRSGTGISMIFS